MNNLKIGLFLFGVILSFSAEAKKIHIHRSGSEDGRNYRKVQEEHSGWGPWANHSLVCKDPGNVFCGWNNPPVIGGHSVADLEAFIRNEIGNGTPSGTTNYNGVVILRWTTLPDGSLEIFMTDEF